MPRTVSARAALVLSTIALVTLSSTAVTVVSTSSLVLPTPLDLSPSPAATWAGTPSALVLLPADKTPPIVSSAGGGAGPVRAPSTSLGTVPGLFSGSTGQAAGPEPRPVEQELAPPVLELSPLVRSAVTLAQPLFPGASLPALLAIAVHGRPAIEPSPDLSAEPSACPQRPSPRQTAAPTSTKLPGHPGQPIQTPCSSPGTSRADPSGRPTSQPSPAGAPSSPSARPPAPRLGKSGDAPGLSKGPIEQHEADKDKDKDKDGNGDAGPGSESHRSSGKD